MALRADSLDRISRLRCFCNPEGRPLRSIWSALLNYSRLSCAWVYTTAVTRRLAKSCEVRLSSYGIFRSVCVGPVDDNSVSQALSSLEISSYIPLGATGKPRSRMSTVS